MKILKVTVKLDSGKVVELSESEAQELLKERFGQKEYIPMPYVSPAPMPNPYPWELPHIFTADRTDGMPGQSHLGFDFSELCGLKEGEVLMGHHGKPDSWIRMTSEPHIGTGTMHCSS